VLNINSFDRVKAALNFKNPDRVPVWKFQRDSDVFMMFKTPSQRWQPGHHESEKGLFPHLVDEFILKKGYWKWESPSWISENPSYMGNEWLNIEREEIDEWGNIWNRAGIDTMGHPGRPTLLDYNDMGEYFNRYTPISDDPECYSLSRSLKNKYGREKYRMAIFPDLGPFQMASQLRGFNNFLVDHYRNKEQLKRLLEYMTDQYIKLEEMYIKFGTEPHGFVLYDDLGEQRHPFVKPDMFEEFYEPVYKRLIDKAHALGCDFHLHCCGKIDRIIPHFVKWGLDSLELDSPRMTGYPDLKPFKGKIMIWGCINIQSVYPQGTPAECEREVWHMMRNLGTQKGGYGAYYYPQVQHIQAPEENVNAFDEGLKKYGTYATVPNHWWDYPTENDWKDDIVPPLPPIKIEIKEK